MDVQVAVVTVPRDLVLGMASCLACLLACRPICLQQGCPWMREGAHWGRRCLPCLGLGCLWSILGKARHATCVSQQAQRNLRAWPLGEARCVWTRMSAAPLKYPLSGSTCSGRDVVGRGREETPRKSS